MPIQIIITNNGSVPVFDEKGNEIPQDPVTLLNPDGSLLTVLKPGACFGMAVDDSFILRPVQKGDDEAYAEKMEAIKAASMDDKVAVSDED